MKAQDCVVVASSQDSLAQKIAQVTHSDMVEVEVDRFPDSESAVKFDKTTEAIRGKTAIIVQSFSFISQKHSINSQLMRFLFLSHQVKAYGARRVIAVVPYLPYIRQCRSVCGTYVGPLEALGRFFKSAGIDKIITCDVHEALCHSLLSVPISEMKLADFWKQQLSFHLNNEDIPNLCFVSPDRGGINRVKEMAYAYSADWAFIEKKRFGLKESKAVELIGNVQGKIVVMLDDIIDSANSAVGACKLLVEKGAKRVIGCFTHAILSKDAIAKIERSGMEAVMITNTIVKEELSDGGRISVVSIDKALGNFVQKIILKDEIKVAEKITWQQNCTTRIKSEQL